MMTMRDCEVVRLVLADEMDWIGGVCRRMCMSVYVEGRKASPFRLARSRSWLWLW